MVPSIVNTKVATATTESAVPHGLAAGLVLGFTTLWRGVASSFGHTRT